MRPHDLHPLGAELPAADVRFDVSGVHAALAESTYRPRRQRDVRKTRHWHLLGSLWRIGSRDLVTVQREGSYVERAEVADASGVVSFTTSLRARSGRHARYQLAEVRLGDVRFARWFEGPPALPPGFGLAVTPDALTGDVLLDGLGAEPLRGALPLWPGLRRVSLRVARSASRRIELFDPASRHHWDGWRQAVPEPWPGGQTITARHIEAVTVWRAHEALVVPPSGAPPVARLAPPAGVPAGVALEVFWPGGARIELPEARFEGPVDVLGFEAGELPPRALALLEDLVTLRPGRAPGTLATAEWDELEDLAAPPDSWPVALAPCASKDRGERVEVRREPRPWSDSFLCVFGAEIGGDGRRAAAALLLHPRPFDGPLPA